MEGEINCPVCQSTRTSKVFVLDPLMAGKRIIPDHPGQARSLSKEIALLWQRDRCEFLRCQNCQYGFAWPFLAGNENIYSLLYYKDFSYPVDKWDYTRAIEIIASLDIRPGSTLLEIGAGNGAFLDKLASLFPVKSHIYSTEYSSASVEEIRRKGYHCYSQSLTELPNEVVTGFDIICIFQVLEHMDDLQGVFKAIGRLSSPSSQLIIGVPNGSLRSSLDKIGVHLDVPPIHVGRFTKKTFLALGKIYGWNMVQICTEQQGYLTKLNKFLYDRYIRVNVTGRTEQWGVPLKKLFRYGIKILLAIRYFPALFIFLFPGTGSSLLVHFERHTTSP